MQFIYPFCVTPSLLRLQLHYITKVIYQLNLLCYPSSFSNLAILWMQDCNQRKYALWKGGRKLSPVSKTDSTVVLHAFSNISDLEFHTNRRGQLSWAVALHWLHGDQLDEGCADDALIVSDGYNKLSGMWTTHPQSFPFYLWLQNLSPFTPKQTPGYLQAKKKNLINTKIKKIVVQRAVSLHVTRATLEETTALAERSW